MALLEVKDLQIHYRTIRGTAKAVDRISFSLEEGQTLGLIGESGCGKSTTAMAMMKLIQPPGLIAGGSIIFDKTDLLTLPENRMREIRGTTISIVRQEAQNALNPVMRIGEQITEIIMAHEPCSKKEASIRARKQLALVGLDENRFGSYPHQFSGGMKQRTMIAIATACRPRLLILDEPITGLDVIVQRQLLTLLTNLKEELSLTAMFIAHDLAVVSETCNRVAVMYGGKIVEQAETETLFSEAMHPYSRALIYSYPSILGEKHELTSIPGSPPDLIHPPKGCRFAPRCSEVMDICHEQEPPETGNPAHSVLCHLYGGRT